ncbi:unnamed protein product [Toxocara canis]|uniref:SCP domain-containing protein n=1 Tax=Toxocara canis TaxID=6265 RepID=A0A183U812_TOXCA|nr:unnamed protein product [Toxocara canis]
MGCGKKEMRAVGILLILVCYKIHAAAELKESHGALPSHIKDALSKYEGLSENMTALPTMWMGSQNEYIFIHSAVSDWRKCLRRIKMPDSVLCIL